LRVDLWSRVSPNQTGLDLAIGVAEEAWRTGARRMYEWSLTVAERIQRDAQLDATAIARLRTHQS
jgi:hypothetical protein